VDVGQTLQDVIILGATFVRSTVYQRIEGVWTCVAEIRPDEYELPTLFGIAVGVSGETILVGDPEHDGYTANSGAVYVFERDPNGDWPQVQILEPTGGVVCEDGDLDEDGDVDLADLAALLAEYGTICP
jgi:hypothetical protein